jgi:hypothetical protein
MSVTSPSVLASTKKSDPGPHPLKVVKFLLTGNQRSMGSSTGTFEIWLQNTSDYIVDKIHIDVEMFNHNGRYIDKITKDIGKLNPGQKKIFDLRYNVVGLDDTDLVPRVWVYYNAGLQRLTQFEVDTANL